MSISCWLRVSHVRSNFLKLGPANISSLRTDFHNTQIFTNNSWRSFKPISAKRSPFRTFTLRSLTCSKARLIFWKTSSNSCQNRLLRPKPLRTHVVKLKSKQSSPTFATRACIALPSRARLTSVHPVTVVATCLRLVTSHRRPLARTVRGSAGIDRALSAAWWRQGQALANQLLIANNNKANASSKLTLQS